jgi:streptogramin lyase
LYYNGANSVYNGGPGADTRLVLTAPAGPSRQYVVYAGGWYEAVAGQWVQLLPGSQFAAYDLNTNGTSSTIRYGTPQEDTQHLGFFTGRLYADGRPIYSITEFNILPATSRPYWVAAGPDGNLWFTDYATNRIGRVTMAGAVTEFPVPTTDSGPNGITAGPDGNLWFTEYTANKIGRVTPSGGFAEFPIPTPHGGPAFITAGPDGNLWFTEALGNKIGCITPGGAISEFSIPTSQSGAWGITAGPDGNVWFTEAHGNKIGRITPNGAVTEFPISTPGSRPTGITAGPDGNVWFTENAGNIGRITPNGTITEFPAFQASAADRSGIVAGPDGNLWVADYPGNKIVRMTTTGSLTVFPVPTTNSGPYGITVGPDGNLWFAEYYGHAIARLILPPAASFRLGGVPATATAGQSFQITVTALDASGDIAYGYHGTVHCTSADAQAQLPPDYAFTAADHGVHTFAVTLRTAGRWGLTVSDPLSSTLQGSSAVATVSPFHFAGGVSTRIVSGPDGNLWWTDPNNNLVWRITPQGTDLRSFPVPGDPQGMTVGPDNNLYLTARRTNQIVKMNPSGQILFSRPINTTATEPTNITVGSDGNLWLVEWNGGPNGGTIVHVSLEGDTLDSHPLVDEQGRAIMPQDIVQGPDGNLWFTPIFNWQTNAYNRIGAFNPNTGHVTWRTLPAGYDEPHDITRGPDGTLWFTVGRAGTHWAIGRIGGIYEHADPQNAVFTLFDVSTRVPNLDGLTVGPDGSIWFPAGSNVGRLSPQGDVQLLPLPDTLPETGDITLGPDRNLWITGDGKVYRIDPSISVIVGTPSVFRLTASATSVTAGTGFSLTVAALDASGNVVTGYQGTVHFTSSDVQAGLPADVVLTNGVGTFSVTLKTAGTQSITVTDTAVSTLTGSLTGIQVNPATATHLWLTSLADLTVVAGSAWGVRVSARDPYNNLAISYTGTVHFSSTDGQASLPADYTFTASDGGIHDFPNGVILRTAGPQVVTATDTQPGISPDMVRVTVNPAAASTFTVTGFPSPVTAGTAATIAVTAIDPYGNVDTNYAGTVHLTSSDGQALLPPDATLTNGVGTFSVTLLTAGSQSITATDTVNATISGVQNGITVTAATADHLQITVSPGITSGTPFDLMVAVLDVYGNVVTGYQGTITFSVTDPDPGVMFPGPYTFSPGTDAGVHTFGAGFVLITPGDQTITVTDDGGLTGSITVTL